MIRFHPSETGGSGGPIFKSRHEKPGDPKDNRIECYQCGFPFDPDKQAEGDTGGDGQTAGIQIQDVSHSFTNTERSLPQQLRDVATFTASSRTVKDPVVASSLGCAFCGSTNPRGKQRDDEASWGRIDLTNQ